MSRYFHKFPKVFYTFDPTQDGLDVVTDVTFPINVLQKYADDSRYWYTQVIKDGLLPEHVAQLVYGDPELHWIILQFNKVVDPQFEWPMSAKNLESYIIAKYGGIAAAQSGVKAYFKVIKRINNATPTEPDLQIIEIGQTEYNNIIPDLAGTDTLLVDGSICTTYTDRAFLSLYDFEVAQNDARREIKIIQKQFIDGILSSFNSIVSNG